MLRRSLGLALAALFISPASLAGAEGIDILRGQFAFDWHSDPNNVKCTAVDGKLFEKLQSAAFHCNLDVVTNTASDKPARICTEAGEGAEYLVFASESDCELERETQASNAE